MATQASSAPASSVPELACVDDSKVCLHLCLRLHLRRHHLRRLNLRHLALKPCRRGSYVWQWQIFSPRIRQQVVYFSE